MSGVFSPKMAPPKDPRSLQDGSKIVLDRYLFLLIYRSDLLSFWVPFWCRFGLPNGAPGGPLRYANRTLGGAKTVLGSSWFGPFFVLRFGFAFVTLLGNLLGPSWGALGPVLGCLELSWARFGAFRRAFWSLQLLFYLLCVLPALCFLLSSHGPRNYNPS